MEGFKESIRVFWFVLPEGRVNGEKATIYRLLNHQRRHGVDLKEWAAAEGERSGWI